MTWNLLLNSAIWLSKDSCVSGMGPSKNDVSTCIRRWFGMVSVNDITFFAKFSQELRSLPRPSSTGMLSNSYWTPGLRFVLYSVMRLISGSPGKRSLIISISLGLSSNCPSASLISLLSSSSISSHKSSSETCSSRFRRVRAWSMVVLPLSFLPTNAARSPTVISPESCMQRYALTLNFRSLIAPLFRAYDLTYSYICPFLMPRWRWRWRVKPRCDDGATTTIAPMSALGATPSVIVVAAVSATRPVMAPDTGVRRRACRDREREGFSDADIRSCKEAAPICGTPVITASCIAGTVQRHHEQDNNGRRLTAAAAGTPRTGPPCQAPRQLRACAHMCKLRNKHSYPPHTVARKRSLARTIVR